MGFSVVAQIPPSLGDSEDCDDVTGEAEEDVAEVVVVLPLDDPRYVELVTRVEHCNAFNSTPRGRKAGHIGFKLENTSG